MCVTELLVLVFVIADYNGNVLLHTG